MNQMWEYNDDNNDDNKNNMKIKTSMINSSSSHYGDAFLLC